MNRKTALIIISCFLLSPALIEAAVDSAGILTQPQLPLAMLSGEVAVATITMANNGTSTWASGYKLVTLSPVWGPQALELDPGETVAPGQQRTWNILARAPYYRGTWPVQWQMADASGMRFGAATNEIDVDVQQNIVVPLGGSYEGDIVVQGQIAYSAQPPIGVTLTGTTGDALGQIANARPYWRGFVNNGTQTLYSFVFSSNFSGQWTWSVVTNLPVVGPGQGAFIVEEDLPDTECTVASLKRGANPYILYNDADPIFLMGDTAWNFATNEFSGSHNFSNYVQHRGTSPTDGSGQHFNYLHGNVYSPDCGGSCSAVNGASQYPFNLRADHTIQSVNSSYFDEVHNRIAAANAQCMVVGVSPGWAYLLSKGKGDVSCVPTCTGGAVFSNNSRTDHTLQDFYDEMINRFSDLKIVWLVASNIDAGTTEPCPGTSYDWELGGGKLTYADIGKYISQNDPNHLITLHPQPGTNVNNAYDVVGTQSWLGINQMQVQQCDNRDSVSTARTDGSGMVALNGEFNYEMTPACSAARSTACDSGGNSNCHSDTCPCDESCKNHHHQTSDVVLHAAWQIALRGGFFVYGDTATYTCQVDENSCYQDAIGSTGAGYMTYLNTFFTEPFSPPELPVLWPSQDFHVITDDTPGTDTGTGSLKVGADDQIIMYAEDNSYPRAHRITDTALYYYHTYDIVHGKWDNGLADPKTPADCAAGNNVPVPGADQVVLANKVEGPYTISCDPSFVMLPPGQQDPESCTVNTDNTISCSRSCTITPSCGAAISVHLTCLTPDPDPSGSTCGKPATLTGCSVSSIDPSCSCKLGACTCASNSPMQFAMNFDLSSQPDHAGDFCVTVQAAGPTTVKYPLIITEPGSYCANFNDGALPDDDWTDKAGYWTVQQDGSGPTWSLQADATDLTAKYRPPTPCSNCTIDAEFSFPPDEYGHNSAKIILSAWFRNGANRLKLIIKDDETDKVSFMLKVNGKKQPKQKRKYAFNTSDTFRMRLGYDPGSMQYVANIQNVSHPELPPMYPPLAIDSGLQPGDADPFGKVELKVTGGVAKFGYLQNCFGCDSGGLEILDPIDSVVEPANGATDAGVAVKLPVPACEQITGQYHTQDDTATAADGDYAAVTDGSFSFAPDGAGEFWRVLGDVFSGLVPPVLVLADSVPNEPTEDFFVKITGPDRGHLDRDTATVTIVESSFAFDCPSSTSVLKGSNKSLSCSITATDGTDPHVSWGCSQLPVGATCIFNPSPWDKTHGSTFTLTLQTSSNTPVSDYNVLVTGTYGTESHTDMVVMHVVDFAPGCPSPLTVVRNHYVDSSVTVGYSSNWTDSSIGINWSCTNLPSGATCAFTPNPWTFGAGSSVALRVQAALSTSVGSYYVTLRGTSGSQVRSCMFQLSVVSQLTYTFYPVGDTFITGYDHLNDNNGLATNLRLQHTPRYSNVLLKFSQQDILNAITGYQVASANLKLYIETNFNNWKSGGVTVDVHRMAGSWQEYITGSPPQGTTWSCAVDTNLNNTNPDCSPQWSGGSYDSAILSSVTHQNNQTGWISYDVKSDLQAIQGGTTHYGWLIRKRNYNDGGSDDYTSVQGTSANKPQLVIVVQ